MAWTLQFSGLAKDVVRLTCRETYTTEGKPQVLSALTLVKSRPCVETLANLPQVAKSLDVSHLGLWEALDALSRRGHRTHSYRTCQTDVLIYNTDINIDTVKETK